jgi:hypothetical protein
MTGTAYFFHAVLYWFRRNPVLTAMMVCSLVLGVTALTAGIAVWRVNFSCAIAERTVLPNVVQVVTGIANRGDLLGQHEALPGGLALSHKDAPAQCACAASIKWQQARPTWQRI